MMRKLIYFIAIICGVYVFNGCNEAGRIDFIDDSSAIPGKVTSINVEPRPGGAIIKYKIPNDPGLLYVKAVYEIQPNVFREAKSSYYTDSLELVGFGDTLSHEVLIYSVGKNEKESEPITASVKPLTPSVKSVFETLKLTATFGGVNVSFVNESQAKLSLVLLVDSIGDGEWSEVKTFYTSADKGSFSVRGFSAEEKSFALLVRDRWNNKSDTLVKSLTPLFEEFIPKTDWKPFYLPSDTYDYVEIFDVTKVWDSSFGYNIFATKHTSPLPQWFTIDLGQSVVLSRLKEFQYHESPYSGASVKAFEVWGSNDPALDGSWDSWTLLGTFESFKPSGLPMGSINGDDINYAIYQGEDFEFSPGIPAVRYIRFKTTETFANTTIGQVVITEISFWGQSM